MRMSRRQEIGAERRERTRRKLLDAAARVVAELGENRATIDDFIRMAGVARGTFYNYYSTRKALMDDLWANVGRTPLLDIQQASRMLDDPAERLAVETRLVLERARSDAKWGWLVYALSGERDLVNDDLRRYPRPDLEAGRRLGRFQFDEIGPAGDFVVSAVRGALRSTLEGPVKPNYGGMVTHMLLRSLGIEDDEAREIANQPLPRHCPTVPDSEAVTHADQ